MKSAKELLDILRKSGAETSRIEVKEAAWLESNSKSVYETICAFANEPFQDGGYLLLGVVEDNEEFKITGVIDADNTINRLTSTCRGEQFSPSVNIECTPEVIEDKTIIIVYVPEAVPPHYPVWYKYKKEKNVYRRRNNADVLCSPVEINELMSIKNREIFDQLSNTRASMQDIDIGSVVKYRKILAENQQYTALLAYDDKDLLLALNCVDIKDNITCPTNAGILLFGTPLAIMRFFPMFRVDCLSLLGFEWVENADKRYHDKISFQENLVSLADKLLSYVVSGLPARPVFQNHTIQRKDEPLLPIVALREAIINMLIHQDFQKNVPIQIRKYGDRLELQNPGYSLKPLEEKDQPRSVPRNPFITNAFHRINYVEALGSGLKSMSRYMQEAGLKEPELISDKANNFFRCTFSLHHFLQDEDITWLRQFSDKINENQVRALIEVRHKGEINNATYRNLNNLGADDKKARNELAALCKKNILKKTGETRWTVYVLADAISLTTITPERYIETSLDPTPTLNKKNKKVSNLTDSTDTLSPVSKKVKPNKLNADISTNEGEKDSVKRSNLTDSIDLLSPASKQVVPDKLNVDISKVTKEKDSTKRSDLTDSIDLLSPTSKQACPATTKRSNVASEILKHCAHSPKKAKELAELTKYNANYLKMNVLVPLVKMGKLQLLYPETPNHPKQAYILAND